MHELSLAHAVVQILDEEARRHQIRQISHIRLRVGRLRAVVPELLVSAMVVAGQGTPAEGAEVVLELVEGRARCPGCGANFAVADLLFLCPDCGAVGGEVLAGQELQVVDFEGD